MNEKTLCVIQEIVYHFDSSFLIKDVDIPAVAKDEAIKLCDKWNQQEQSDNSRIRRFRFKVQT